MKLLWCSDHPVIPTGYGQVTRNLLFNFKKSGIDTHCFGFQGFGQTINNMTINNEIVNYPVYSQLAFGENYGDKGSIVFWENQLKPDVTAFLCDSFMIKHLTDERIDKNKDGKSEIVKWINGIKSKKLIYFPFDSDTVYEDAKPIQEAMDIRVAMSKYSQKVLKKDTGLDSFYIPHGCDTSIFRPLNKDKIADVRKQNKWEDKFVVGCVARNQTRKQLTRLYDAFKIFAQDKDDVILFMHTSPVDNAGPNLIEYSKQIGISEKIVYTGLKSPVVGFPPQQVNLVYNTMDVHVLPTTGEGFGLPIIESMAAGTPNICTDYTTSRELLEGHGEFAKIKSFVTGDKSTNRALVDTEDLAKKIEKLYNNQKLREKYSKTGREFVLQHYTWEKAIRMWLDLFEFGEIHEKY